MSQATFRSASFTTLVRELRDRDRFLFTVAVLNFGLAVLFTGLIYVDGRTLLGRNVWIKPWKFATSITIYTATVGWILTSLSLGDRLEWFASRTIGAAMLIEITLISTQAARGVPSHFNDSTALDTAIFAVMGMTITLSTLVVVYVLWRIIRYPPSLSPAYLWSLRIGMFLFVLASFEGWVMIGQGSHSVGAEATATLPLLNWNLNSGDLRVAHFIGLHSLQIIPFTGFLASYRYDESHRKALSIVGLVGILYSVFIGATFWQALLGNPIVTSVPIGSVSPAMLAGVLIVIPLCVLVVLLPRVRALPAG